MIASTCQFPLYLPHCNPIYHVQSPQVGPTLHATFFIICFNTTSIDLPNYFFYYFYFYFKFAISALVPKSSTFHPARTHARPLACTQTRTHARQACAQMRAGAFKCKCKRRIKCKCKCTAVETNANANAQQLNQMQMQTHLDQMQMHLDQIQMHLDQMQMLFYNYGFFCVHK